MRADYRKGFEDGITAFAWWKDGVQMVGTTGKTLATALEHLEEIYGFNPAPTGLQVTLQHDETGRLLEWSLDSAKPMPSGYSIVFDEKGPVVTKQLAQISAEWRKDSSLEKWFPITAEELAKVKANYCQLYALVESYLCTPNTEPIIEDHYKALVAWFVRSKRPDGTEPRPVSPEQTH